jgi:hypothetical protein
MHVCCLCTYTHCIIKWINFNIFLPSMLKLPKWSLPEKCCMPFSSLLCMLYVMLISSYSKKITLIIFREECKLWHFILCTFIQCPVLSSLLGTNILIILLSNILNLCSSWRMRDQVSRSYTTSKIICLYTLTFTILDKRWENNFELNSSKHSLYLICS